MNTIQIIVAILFQAEIIYLFYLIKKEKKNILQELDLRGLPDLETQEMKKTIVSAFSKAFARAEQSELAALLRDEQQND